MARCHCGYNHAGQLVTVCATHAKSKPKKKTTITFKKKLGGTK